MVLDTTKETICINQIVGQKTDNFTVEGDIIVPDIKPDILKVVSTSGKLCVYKKEVLDGKLRIDGSVNTYIIYLADGENEGIRGLNTSLDFTQIIDFEKCKNGMNIEENINIRQIDCKILNGRKINIKAYMDINASLYSNNNIDIVKEVSEIENLQTLNDNLEINSLVGSGNSKAFAKDTIVIDNIDNLAEILKVDMNVVNKETKISYNKVLAKADTNVKIMYLTEDNRINVVNSKIPIMGFIDIPNVNDENICDMKYKIKNFILKPNEMESHSIYVEVEIELSCYVYDKRNINILQDLYSPMEDLKFSQKEVETMCYKENIKDLCTIKQNVTDNEMAGKKLYDVEVNWDIINQEILNNRVNYEGKIYLKYIYEDETSGGLNSKKVELPFDFNVDREEINSNFAVETNIELQDSDFIIMPDGSIENKIELGFNINISKKEVLNIIDEITLEEQRTKEVYSIIIYFVKPADTLWKIAKRFKSTIEDIARINNIENPNKISVGMQLLIPRYISQKTA